MSETFHACAAADDMANGQSRAVELNGWPVLLCRQDDKFFAVINRCTHAASAMDGGRIRRNTVSCPLHGARFDMATGSCVGAPYLPLKIFSVRVEDGQVWVAVPDVAPGPEHMPIRGAYPAA